MSTQHSTFTGFDLPESNYFRLPKNWTDVTCEMTSLSELKCVEFVLKWSWSFHEYGIAKRITIDEFRHGRKRKNGTRLDKGTGLSKPSVVEGLKRAVKHGYLREEVDNSDKARVKKYYELKIKQSATADNDQGSTQHHQPQHQNHESAHQREDNQDRQAKNSGVKDLNAGVKNLNTWGNDLLHRSEKDIDNSPSEKENIYNFDIIDNKNSEKDKKPKSEINSNPTPPVSQTQSPLKKLPALDLETEQVQHYAKEMAEALNDEDGLKFYLCVAWRVPEGNWRPLLAKVTKDTEVRKPAAMFNREITAYAKNKLEKTASEEQLKTTAQKKAELLANLTKTSKRTGTPRQQTGTIFARSGAP